MKSIVTTSWSEISSDVKIKNPPLFEVIDSHSDLKKHPLRILKYQYGEVVGDDNFFYTPRPNAASSSTIPFSMVLNNFFEMPIKVGDRSIPWKIYKPGDLFPYTRFLPTNRYYEPSNWLYLIAGSTSSFLLINQISDKKWHKLLCNRYNVNIAPPKSFSEHSDIFKSLVSSREPNWSADLLVFSEGFFNAALKNHDFKELIFHISHQDKLFRRNIYSYELLFHEVFMKTKSIKSSFVRDCIKHLLYVGSGDLPAYFPTDDESYGPVNFLTEAYVEGFKSKSCPIFMTTDFFTPFENLDKGYFSLNNLDYLFKPNKIPSQATIIKDIKSGYDEVTDKIILSNMSQESIFIRAAMNVEINPIIKGDKSFISTIKNDSKFTSICKKFNLPFPENSTFLTSGMSLHYKSNEFL